MAKKLTIELLDNGSPCQNISVNVTGCSELETGITGSVFFLVEDDPATVAVSGKAVHTSPLEALPSKMTLNKDGSDWKVA